MDPAKLNLLVLSLRERRKWAYEEIYHDYFGVIHHLSLQYLHDATIAEEVVQDSFMKLWEIRNKAVITVKSVGKLSFKGKEIFNFQLAGKDKVFYPATAKFEKNNAITLSAPNVTEPVAVRYCFTNDAVPNLFDENGLPLFAFRTDDWK